MKSGMVALEENAKRVGDRDNPGEILEWMHRLVQFEDGLTLREFMHCLSPWSAIIDAMADMDFDAWMRAMTQPAPPLSDNPRERLVRVEVRPFIVVNRDERTCMARVKVEWEIFGVLEEPDEHDGRRFDIIGLDLTHPSVYADLPVVIREEAEVSDVMVGCDAAPWNQEPSIHATADGKVRGFTVYPSVVDAVIYGFFEKLSSSGSPDDVQEKIETIVAGVEAIWATN
jgi:hypothetical protein